VGPQDPVQTFLYVFPSLQNGS